MDNLPFDSRDVLFLLGYPAPSHHSQSVNIDCPMCKGKKKLNFNLKKNQFRCNKCTWYGNNITFYASERGISNKEAYKEICERTNNGSSGEYKKVELRKVEIEKEIPDNPMAEIRVRNNTYSELNSELDLSQKHYENLLSRGFSPEFIINHGYKSYPTENYKEIAVALLQQGCTLSGVPGFYRDKDQKWTMTYSKNGIIVQYRDFNNLIQGVQIRIDNELIEPEESKYKWLSSRYREEGCRAETFIHYACDFAWSINDKTYMPLCRNNTFVITEGAMKGDLFFSLTGQSTLALPGVNCLNMLDKEFDKLKKIGITNYLIAYDMDFVKNIYVMLALNKIIDLIKKKGFTYKILTWNCNIRSQNGETCPIPLIVNGMFNCFVFTPKSYMDAVKKEQIDIIKKALKQLNINNIMFSVPKISMVTPDEKKVWEKVKTTFKEFNLHPVEWNLTYKGIDDYYAYKIRK